MCCCVHRVVWRGERHGWNVKECLTAREAMEYAKHVPLLELLNVFKIGAHSSVAMLGMWVSYCY